MSGSKWNVSQCNIWKIHGFLVDDMLKLDDGSEVQISKCPDDHGKIKSP